MKILDGLAGALKGESGFNAESDVFARRICTFSAGAFFTEGSVAQMQFDSRGRCISKPTITGFNFSEVLSFAWGQALLANPLVEAIPFPCTILELFSPI